MTTKDIAVAADHAGVELKSALKEMLLAEGYAVRDYGTEGKDSVDYPDFAARLVAALVAGEAGSGILICGSGVGMSIAANRHPAIRAALCQDGLTAELSRAHNDANVLVLGARLIGVDVAKECVRRFLNTPFAGGRHAGRVAKLSGKQE